MSRASRGRGLPAGRRQLTGVSEVDRALAEEAPVRLVLVRRGSADPGVRQLVERARARGIPVVPTSANDLRRMSRTRVPAEALALVGPDPEATLPEVLEAAPGTVVWLLAGVRYPGNAGYAIRTAEVSGARAIVLDAGFDARGRKQALRASMRADRFFPVFWEEGERVVREAQAAGRTVVALEDVGDRTPWEIEGEDGLLYVIGGEDRGVPEALLRRADAVARIPMAGFIPSYNLHAAMAVVVGEHLRRGWTGSSASGAGRRPGRTTRARS